jgi:hypothetical protein
LAGERVERRGIDLDLDRRRLRRGLLGGCGQQPQMKIAVKKRTERGWMFFIIFGLR